MGKVMNRHGSRGRTSWGSLETYRKARRLLAVVTRRGWTMVDLGQSKTRLETELARVNRRIEDLKREPESEELASGGDNTPLSEEVDVSVIAQERVLRDKLLGSLLERAAALEEALGRVADGSYGFCDVCQARISESRLGALPEVSLCATCQERREQGTRLHRSNRTRTDKRSTL